MLLNTFCNILLRFDRLCLLQYLLHLSNPSSITLCHRVLRPSFLLCLHFFILNSINRLLLIICKRHLITPSPLAHRIEQIHWFSIDPFIFYFFLFGVLINLRLQYLFLRWVDHIILLMNLNGLIVLNIFSFKWIRIM